MIDLVDKIIYSIDYDKDDIELKSASMDLTSFIDQLAQITVESNKSQLFKIKDPNTQVISLASKIICLQGEVDKDRKIWENYAHSIATRLLDREQKVQDEIKRFKIDVKKGSLLQAILYDEESEAYLYLITKIEHKDFFEDKNYQKLSGFSADKNKFFKSCLIRFNSTEESILEIESIHVFLDNPAKYWYEDFLEVESIRRDDKNTKLMFNHIEKVLKNYYKNSERTKYCQYRNHILGYMRSHPRIHYDDMIGEVFIDTETNRKENAKILEILYSLPDKKNFDREFNVIRSEIEDKRISRLYNVNQGIKLLIGYMPEEIDCISIKHEPDGLTYLKIQTNDQELIETFDRERINEN